MTLVMEKLSPELRRPTAYGLSEIKLQCCFPEKKKMVSHIDITTESQTIL